MTMAEIKDRIKAIDALLDSDETSEEEFDRLEAEARELTAELGRLESMERLRNANKIAHLNDWEKNFLSGFAVGSRAITNKQAEIFNRIGHGKPFIYQNRRYDLGLHYRAGFKTLFITPI